jgi:excisionase family DNA binding protein
MDNKYLEGGIPKVAEVLGLNNQTVYRHAKEGKFPFIKKVGSRYVVIESAFNEWMFTSSISKMKELRAENV